MEEIKEIKNNFIHDIIDEDLRNKIGRAHV